MKNRTIISILLVVSALLVFPGLDDTCLWQDEAVTALLAKNILSFGVPKASDGKNLVTSFWDRRDARNGLYIWEPWFPMYLTAGSIAVAGANSLGARFPFALSFVILVVYTYYFVRRWYPDHLTALLCVTLMIGCIPLLLHARQSRYYLLVPLFSLLIVNAYLNLISRPRLITMAGLIVWLSLLFHSFYPGVILLALSLGIDLIRRRPGQKIMRWFVLAGVITFLINLPWAVYYRIWSRDFGVQPGYSGLNVFGMYFLRYLLTLHNYFFPLIVVAFGCLLYWKDLICGKLLKKDPHFLLLCICLIQLVGFSLLSDYPFTRYLIGTTPFLMMLAAILIRKITRGNLWLSWALILLITLTNILHILPLIPFRHTGIQKIPWTVAGVNSAFLEEGNVGYSYARGEVKQLIHTSLNWPPANYIRSILDPPQGPVDGIVAFLNEAAAPNDRVKIAYGDRGLMYHTELFIIGKTEKGPPDPEWFVLRRFNGMGLEQFLNATKGYRYSMIELPVPDLQWNNRPDPLYHYFKAPALELSPKIRILKREKNQ